MKPQEPTEHAEQCAVITWASHNTAKWPALHLLYAVPNGAFFGSETKLLKTGKKLPVAAIRARKLKAEGLKEGVPDLCLPVRSHSHAGLYIELKRRTLGRPSPMQDWWRSALLASGYHCVLCHGADSAMTALRSYLADCAPLTLPPFPALKPKTKTNPKQPRARKAPGVPRAPRRPVFLTPPALHPLS
jgi:hypothetical protein